mgnify:CR=1 FL=1
MPDGSFWVITDNGMGSRYNSADSDAVPEPAQDRLGDRQDRAPGNHLPARSRQEGAVPHRARGHRRSAISPAPISTPKAFRSSATPSGSATSSAPISSRPIAAARSWPCSRPWPMASRCARPITGRCSRRARRARATPTSTCAAPRAMKVLHPRRTANSSTACSKARCGMPRRRIGKRSTARKPRASSNSTSPAESSPAATGNMCSSRTATRIGDFNMIDAASGLIIERDNGEGTADKACPQGHARRELLSGPRQIQARLQGRALDANVGKPARKIAYIDLMKISDPDKKARKPPQRRRADLPVLHHRECRSGRRDAHHRRQRQQPAVLLEPRSQQGRRQRVRAARGRPIS